MASKRTVAWNVALNVAGIITRMATGFVALPLLLYRLDDTGYGLWVLIASCTAYFGLLDLGMRGSLGRNVAYARAKNDQHGINVLISSGLAVTGAAALVACLASALVGLIMPSLVTIPPESITEVRWALVLAGLGIASTLAFSIFDSTLWAYQRFDVINAIEIVASLLRLGLTYLLVSQSNGLITLSLITFGVALGSDLLKALVSFWLVPGLRPRLHQIQRPALGVLFNYGTWNFVGSIGRRLTEEGALWVIAIRLGAAMVAPFAPAWRLLAYAAQVMTVGAEAITPVATALHAQDKRSHQQQLFLEGTKFALALGLFFLGGFLFLGRSFLALWIGPRFADFTETPTFLVILMLGELLPMSQIITRSILLGMGKPRIPATLSIIENVIAIPLALLVAVPYGLLGVCIVIASVAASVRGLGMIVLGSREVRVPLAEVLLRGFLPAVACGVAPIALLGVLTAMYTPGGWGELVACGLGYAAVYGVFVVLILIGIAPLLRHSQNLLTRRNEQAHELSAASVASSAE